MTYFSVRVVLETPNGPLNQYLIQPNYQTYNLVLHESHTDGNQKEFKESSSDTQDVILHILILIHFFLYFIKILFELSLGISRITNFLELGNLGAMFIIIVLRFIDFVLQNNIPLEGQLNSTKYIPFHQFIIIEQSYLYCLAICSFFYPFRIYQYLSHYPFFEPCVTVMSTFSRTAPGIVVFFFLIIILVVCFAMGIHVILGSQF